MLVHINGAECIGIDAVRVIVEVDVTRGIGIHLVGLADTAVKESLLRTTTALQGSGYRIPGMKIVINLAPADLRKNGSGYDLPIALGIIAASEQENFAEVGDFLIMGELGLDASVRPVPGAIVHACMAKELGLKGIILPEANAEEASHIEGIKVYGVRSLRDAAAILKRGSRECEALGLSHIAEKSSAKSCYAEPEVDFADIIGQESARRGMEIAAAGGHNVIMVGAPGSGKTSMAKALAGILPPMTAEEAITTAKIYSVAGLSDRRAGMENRRPFRAPHCSVSGAALTGGVSSGRIIPGEVSLANNGVLFIDEFGQVPRHISETLRGPLEDRRIVVSRLRSKVSLPASFMLVAASNPCPCGYFGEGDRCTCLPHKRDAYMSKLSGPVMDRIDIQLRVRPVPAEKLAAHLREQMAAGRGKAVSEPSSAIASRVAAARERQRLRFEGLGISTNAEMNNAMIRRFCPLGEDSQKLLASLSGSSGLSVRACMRVIRIARSIADIEGAEAIECRHIAEAASFRSLEKIENLGV